MPKTPAKRGTRSQISRSVRPSEKAYWHQVSGAGKSHVKRQFFGISPSDSDIIARELGILLERNVSRES